MRSTQLYDVWWFCWDTVRMLEKRKRGLGPGKRNEPEQGRKDTNVAGGYDNGEYKTGDKLEKHKKNTKKLLW